jgi:hypothetical protein
VHCSRGAASLWGIVFRQGRQLLNDDVRTNTDHSLKNALGIERVTFNWYHTGLFQFGGGFFGTSQAIDGMVPIQQLLDQRRTNRARSACNKNLHSNISF